MIGDLDGELPTFWDSEIVLFVYEGSIFGNSKFTNPFSEDFGVPRLLAPADQNFPMLLLQMRRAPLHKFGVCEAAPKVCPEAVQSCTPYELQGIAQLGTLDKTSFLCHTVGFSVCRSSSRHLNRNYNESMCQQFGALHF